MVTYEVQLSRPAPAGWKPWMGRAFEDEQGRLYVPAACAGLAERGVWMSLVYDGESFVEDGGHIYVPAAWLVREFPESAEVVGVIERAVRSSDES